MISELASFHNPRTSAFLSKLQFCSHQERRNLLFIPEAPENHPSACTISMMPNWQGICFEGMWVRAAFLVGQLMGGLDRGAEWKGSLTGKYSQEFTPGDVINLQPRSKAGWLFLKCVASGFHPVRIPMHSKDKVQRRTAKTLPPIESAQKTMTKEQKYCVCFFKKKKVSYAFPKLCL